MQPQTPSTHSPYSTAGGGLRPVAVTVAAAAAASSIANSAKNCAHAESSSVDTKATSASTVITELERPVGNRPLFAFSGAAVGDGKLVGADGVQCMGPRLSMSDADRIARQIDERVTYIPKGDIQLRGRDLAREKQEYGLLIGASYPLYRFPGFNHRLVVLPWSDLPALTELAAFVGKTYPTDKPNHAIVTRYESEHAGIGDHSDKVQDIAPGSRIFAFSFLASRPMTLTCITTKKVQSVLLDHGSLVVLDEATNRLFQHAIPKQTCKCGPRISIVLRTIKTYAERKDGHVWIDGEKKQKTAARTDVHAGSSTTDKKSIAATAAAAPIAAAAAPVSTVSTTTDNNAANAAKIAAATAVTTVSVDKNTAADISTIPRRNKRKSVSFATPEATAVRSTDASTSESSSPPGALATNPTSSGVDVTVTTDGERARRKHRRI